MHLCAPCSESRAAHKLSAKLNRDIIIGGSSLNTPHEFVEQLKVHPLLFSSQNAKSVDC